MTRPRPFGALRTDHGALSVQRHGFGQGRFDVDLLLHLGVFDRFTSSSARGAINDDTFHVHFHVDHWSETKQKLASGSVFHYIWCFCNLYKKRGRNGPRVLIIMGGFEGYNNISMVKG